MSGLQSLKTAFWSLMVSLCVLSLLFVFCPQVTRPVIALFSAPIPTEPADEELVTEESLATQADDEWGFPEITEQRSDRPSEEPEERTRQTAQVVEDDDEFEQFVASQHASRKESPLPTHREQSSAAAGDVIIHPAAVQVSTPKPQPAINEELKARLASLQSAIDRLAQAEADRKTAQIERAAERLEHRRQTERLRDLEQQLRDLQAKQLAAISSIKQADDKSQTAVPKQQSKPVPESVVDEGSERFTFVLLGAADLSTVLEELGRENGYNIVIGEGVGGTVQSVALRNVTIDAALNSLVGPSGLVFERDGASIYVMTESEHIARKASAATVTAERDGPVVQ